MFVDAFFNIFLIFFFSPKALWLCKGSDGCDVNRKAGCRENKVKRSGHVRSWLQETEGIGEKSLPALGFQRINVRKLNSD